MARDIEDNELFMGDVVVCIEEASRLYIKNGEIFTVLEVRGDKIKIERRDEANPKIFAQWFSSTRFKKHVPGSSTVEDKADQIMSLINRRPWSPSRDEILEILKS